jgi:hypothetical protein
MRPRSLARASASPGPRSMKLPWPLSARRTLRWPPATAASCPTGHNRAVTAVAHALLCMAYQVLASRAPFPGPRTDYVDRRHRVRVTRRAVHPLERQVYRVILGIRGLNEVMAAVIF